MGAAHITKEYVKQITESATAFTSQMKTLSGFTILNPTGWKPQLSKAKIALEHFDVLVKGFHEQYKQEKNPAQSLKDLASLVVRAKESIKLDRELVTKF